MFSKSTITIGCVAAIMSLSVFGDDKPAKPSSKTLQCVGYVVPVQRASVGPKMPGIISRIHVREGEHVKKGQVLAQLDDQALRLQLDAARAKLMSAQARYAELKAGPRREELAMAEAAVDEAKAALESATRDYRRVQEMRAKNVISEQDFNQAKSRYDQATVAVKKAELMLAAVKETPRRERLEVAMAELRETEANARIVEHMLESATIRAPFDGTIVVHLVAVGNFVNPTGVGAVICEIIDANAPEVHVEIAERDLTRVQVGQTCELQASVYPDKPFKGTLTRIRPVVDPAKGTVTVIVGLEAPTPHLLPHMQVRVSFLSRSDSK